MAMIPTMVVTMTTDNGILANVAVVKMKRLIVLAMIMVKIKKATAPVLI
jgi:hypothetical protein